MKNMKLTKTINSGVIIEYQGTKILVDGLYGEDHLFNPLSQEQKKNIINGAPPYDNIDVLLFTHLHSDHYSKELVKLWLNNHSSSKIIMPKENDFVINDQTSNIITVGGEEFAHYGDFEKVQVRGIKTGHIMLDHPEHYCYEVSCEEGSVILTGDMSIDKLCGILQNRLKENCILFLNPLLIYEAWKNKVCLDEITKLKKVFIYHLPSEEYDKLNFRKSIVSLWPEISAAVPNGRLLLSEMMVLCNE